MSVKVDNSNGMINYDDDINTWEADMIVNEQNKSVILLGTAHKLTTKERSDVITEILNKLAFGNYINRNDYIYDYKLKNRDLEKNEEENMLGRSLPMLAEAIIELPINENECKQITYFRNVYKSIKLAVEEAESLDKYVIDNIDFEYYGSFLYFKKYKTIFEHLIPNFEYVLSKKSGRKIEIEFNAKYTVKNKIFSFRVEEA